MKSSQWFVVALLSAAVLVAGCGRLRVDFSTDVLSAEEISQEVAITGEGLFAEALRSSEDDPTAQAAEEGWTVETESLTNDDGDELYVMRMSKVIGPEDELFPSDGAAGARPRWELQVAEVEGGTEYRVRVVLPPSAAGGPAGELGSDPDAIKLLSSMFRMSWTINLPGEIVETNADRRTERGGRWNLTMEQMEKGRELVIASRE